MDIITIFVIATGLSMDSFAVSVANGFSLKSLRLKRALIIAASFSVFQTLMPVAGWSAGKTIERYIRDIDHWIAFGLLLFLGIRMIYEGIKNQEFTKNNELKMITLFTQSFATSIDALAVGLSFAFLNVPIGRPVIIIGSVTFLFSISGLYIGKYFGKKIRNGAEIFGGSILVFIGFKILLEHLYQWP